MEEGDLASLHPAPPRVRRWYEKSGNPVDYFLIL
jgi:hypothetical protein